MIMDIKSATSVAIDRSKKDDTKGYFVYETENGFTVETDYRSGWVVRAFQGEWETFRNFIRAKYM